MNATQTTILAVFLALAMPVAVRIVLALIQIRRMVKQDMETGHLERILETTRANIADEEPAEKRRPPPPPRPQTSPPIPLCVCPLCGHHHRPSSER